MNIGWASNATKQDQERSSDMCLTLLLVAMMFNVFCQGKGMLTLALVPSLTKTTVGSNQAGTIVACSDGCVAKMGLRSKPYLISDDHNDDTNGNSWAMT